MWRRTKEGHWFVGRPSPTLLAGAVITSLALATVTPAGAAYPGANGKIVFGSDRDRANGYNDLYVVTPGVPGAVRLTDNVGEVWDVHPAWSPDGGRIVFARYDTHDYEIFVMNEDGSNPLQLTDNDVNDYEPAWSPDGRKIAYTTWGRHADGGENWDTWIMNPDGSGKRLLFDGGGYDMEPDWSPDGSRIALERDDEIWVIDADGAHPRRMTNNSQYDSAPQWHPDGTRLVYTSVVAGNPEVCAVDVITLAVTQLTSDGHARWETCWSPDGTRIMFQRNDGEDWEIVTIAADGSDLVPVTDNTGWDLHPAWQRVLEPPAAQIGPMVDLIRALVIKTRLSRSAGAALIAKLEQAEFYIVRGNETQALRVLRAFIRQVNSLVSFRRISVPMGRELVAGALTIVAQLIAP
jgi:Tol biopolymer transport system component